MTWRDKLLQPSFRGVPFWTDSTARHGGRRLHVIEFPRRSKPAVHDLGRRPSVHTIDAYVNGDDYMLARDRLITALEQEGPGELVHPYHGQVRVSVERWRELETSRDGGMARFSITFVEAPEKSGLQTEDDPASVLDQAAQSVKDQAGAQLLEDLAVDGVPEFVREAGVDQMFDLGGIVDKMGVFSDVAEDIAAQAQRVEDLIERGSELITSPVSVRDAIVDAISGVRGKLTNAVGALSSFERLFDLGIHSRRSVSGSARLAQSAQGNAQAIVTLARHVAVAEATRAAAAAPWETYEDALAARESILAEIDGLADLANDEAFLALLDLRAGLVGSVPREAESLPRLGSTSVSAPVPALVLAYELYGATDREADIVARNRVRHPGFLPAGTPLGVLVDV